MELQPNQWFKVLAPRPVVLITTVNAKGVSNAAPFSFVMPVSCQPALVAFASSPKHHTAKNILQTKEFVVNIPSCEIVRQLWICADGFPEGVSETKKAKLSEEKSSQVKSPRIKECFAHFECNLFRKYRLGDHLLIIGLVVKADIRDDLMAEGKFLITKANTLIHIGSDEFAVLTKIFKVK